MKGHTDPLMTVAEYLTFEESSVERHEFFQGRIFALAGASEEHSTITGNVFASLHRQLREKPCKVYATDIKVKIDNTGLYTYPDVSVVCGRPQFEDSARTVLLNPIVIIEVLSPSTENYDRGQKFRHYRSIAAMQEYVLVEQQMKHIEHYIRQADGNWLFSSANDDAPMLLLPSIGCSLALAEVYEKVTFTETGSDPSVSGLSGRSQ